MHLTLQKKNTHTHTKDSDLYVRSVIRYPFTAIHFSPRPQLDEVKLAINLFSIFYFLIKQRQYGQVWGLIFNFELFNQVMGVICFPLSSCHLHLNSSLPAAFCRDFPRLQVSGHYGSLMQMPHYESRTTVLILLPENTLSFFQKVRQEGKFFLAKQETLEQNGRLKEPTCEMS